MLSMNWWPALLGWPAIAMSVGMASAGVLLRNEYLVLGAIVPILPVGFYILGSPLYWWLPVAIVLLLAGLGWFIRLKRRDIDDR